MRIGIVVLGGLVGVTGLAMAQAGGHGGGAASGGGAAIGRGMSAGGGMHAAGTATGSHPSGGIGPRGYAPRISPSMSPGRFTSPTNLGSGQIGSQSLTGQDGRPGNWTSSGFIPSANGQPQYGGVRNNHVGYGAVGYPVFAYGAGYYGGGVDDYDANDGQARPQDSAAANGYGPQDAGPGYGQQYPGGYGPGPQDAAAAGWGDPGSGARPAYRGGNAEAAAVTDQQPRTDGLTHPKVTLIFKDGRKPLQVQNYAMTQTKIYVRDQGAEQDVAISDLDVAATMSANDRAGIDFALPVKN